MKKAIIIISSIIVGVVLALATAFLLIKFGGTLNTDAPISNNSEPPVISQPADVPPVEITPIESLTFTSPKYETFTTTDETVTFAGNLKADGPLLLDGDEILCDENGNFTKTMSLKYGQNTFKFTVNGTNKTFVIYRRYVIIKSYTPQTAQTLSAGGKLNVTVTARTGASVTAKLNGTTVTLSEKTVTGDGFSVFKGSFTMPKGHFTDKNLGKIVFNGSHGGYSESFNSQNITCKREDIVVDSNPAVTPSGGSYIDVGSGIICEITAFQAETFDGKGNTDKSKPYNNYLPEGTVDYCKGETTKVVTNGKTHELITMRCGKKVYKEKVRSPYKDFTEVSKQYTGELPDHNELSIDSFSIDGNHTVLTLDTDWKAPFVFELKNQSYNSNFTVDNITYNYVDITFCYATVFEGEITVPENHPLFSKAEIFKNSGDCTLRLTLKKTGAFYGWDCYYNSQNQLCFEFLNPAKVTVADNDYGADLTGVKILIDIGHGGKVDTGSVGKGNVSEKDRNLALGKKIKAELESLGATVKLTRETDIEQLADTKVKILKSFKPDYCICIHHDGNNTSSLNGFGSYYYQPYSKKAAEFIKYQNSNLEINGSKVYKNTTLKWHYYFMGRCSVCPVVLTENGYMTNSYDLGNIKSEAVNERKAQAITQGIVDYFLSIQA